MQTHRYAQTLRIWDLQAFPWQQWGQEGKDGAVQPQQMMDGRGDHLFVEQRQRFAVLTPSVDDRATRSAVIDTALCGIMSGVGKTQEMSSLMATILVVYSWCYQLESVGGCLSFVQSER